MAPTDKDPLQLVSIPYSPWSLRAKFALKHHNIPYKSVPYTPKVDEPWLRYKIGRWSGDVTVPVAFDYTTKPYTILTDSLDIARYADEVGQGSPLFPAELTEELNEWNKKIDQMLQPLRIISLRNSVADEDVKQESLPSWAKSVGFVGSYIYNSAVSYIINKYPVPNEEESERQIRQTLDEIKQKVESSKTGYLFGDQITYGDINIVCGLQLVLPADDKYVKLQGPGQRKAMTYPLYSEYPEIFTWRDQILEKHWIKVN